MTLPPDNLDAPRPETARVTRGEPIERIDDTSIVGNEYTLLDKLNEIIDCINKMNEVSR